MSSDSSFPNVDENNEEILNNIQNLQKIEQSLFSSLESNPSLTTEQQQQIIDKISDISNMRMNLYKTLNEVNGFFLSALSTSQGTLQQQAAAIGIVESELNDAKIKLTVLEQEKNNKIRLIEINNFYGDKYKDQTSLMKLIFYMFLLLLILAFIYQSGFLPKNIFLGLLILVSVIGGYMIVIKTVYMWNRDNMNYQEYDFYFDAASAPDPSGNSTDPWAIQNPTICPTVTSSETSNTDTTVTVTETENFLPASNAFAY
jgi:hypothetical protein